MCEKNAPRGEQGSRVGVSLSNLLGYFRDSSDLRAIESILWLVTNDDEIVVT